MKTQWRNFLILPALLSIPLLIFPACAFSSPILNRATDFKISTNVDLVLLDVGVKTQGRIRLKSAQRSV